MEKRCHLFVFHAATVIGHPLALRRVSFSSCQRNLIKTFQSEAIIALITKMAMIFS